MSEEPKRNWVSSGDKPHPRVVEAKSEPAPMSGGELKFCILAHGDVERENVLYVLNSKEERDTKTFELIYGHSYPETAQESDMWRAEQEELNENGELNFEGDPGLRWFVALLTETPNPTDAKREGG